MTATGLIDGIYADHSSEKGVGIGYASPCPSAKWKGNSVTTIAMNTLSHVRHATDRD